VHPGSNAGSALLRRAGSDVGDIDAGLATPLEVWQGLAAEGFNVAYRRLPLSRERTPEAADLDVLHRQLLTQPDGARPEQPRTLP